MRNQLVTPHGTVVQVSEDEFAVFLDVGCCLGVCDSSHLRSLGMRSVNEWLDATPEAP